MPMFTATDEDLADLEKATNYAMRLQRKMFDNVPPKFHALLHMLEDMHRFRGLLELCEDAIERAHQDGNRLKSTVAKAKSSALKALIAMNKDEVQQQHKIKALTYEIKEGRKRKLKTNKKSEQEEQTKKQRIENRKQLLELEELDYKLGSISAIVRKFRRIEIEKN
jgi:hypothetical protein